MTRQVIRQVIRRGAALVAATAVLAACGSTYVDTSVDTGVETGVDSETSVDREAGTAAGTAATTTTTPPLAADISASSPIADRLTAIDALVSDLSEQIVADEGQYDTLARIEEIWAVTEPEIRSERPDELFNFEQALDLARTGVERRRPADASKGARILTAVVDDYLAS